MAATDLVFVYLSRSVSVSVCLCLSAGDLWDDLARSCLTPAVLAGSLTRQSNNSTAMHYGIEAATRFSLDDALPLYLHFAPLALYINSNLENTSCVIPSLSLFLSAYLYTSDLLFIFIYILDIYRLQRGCQPSEDREKEIARVRNVFSTVCLRQKLSLSLSLLLLHRNRPLPLYVMTYLPLTTLCSCRLTSIQILI